MYQIPNTLTRVARNCKYLYTRGINWRDAVRTDSLCCYKQQLTKPRVPAPEKKHWPMYAYEIDKTHTTRTIFLWDKLYNSYISSTTVRKQVLNGMPSSHDSGLSGLPVYFHWLHWFWHDEYLSGCQAFTFTTIRLPWSYWRNKIGHFAGNLQRHNMIVWTALSSVDRGKRHDTMSILAHVTSFHEIFGTCSEGTICQRLADH